MEAIDTSFCGILVNKSTLNDLEICIELNLAYFFKSSIYRNQSKEYSLSVYYTIPVRVSPDSPVLESSANSKRNAQWIGLGKSLCNEQLEYLDIIERVRPNTIRLYKDCNADCDNRRTPSPSPASTHSMIYHP